MKDKETIIAEIARLTQQKFSEATLRDLLKMTARELAKFRDDLKRKPK